MQKIIMISMVILMVGCASIKSSSLPVGFQVVDAGNDTAISNATVELQWSVGFLGYYWGQPVAKKTDSNGFVTFSDVPAISSDGYTLKKPIQKLFVTAVIASAPGYRKVALRYPEQTAIIKLNKE